jgi:hypothetical protein
LGTDVVDEGVLHKFTHEKNQLRNGDMPWRGGRKKDPLFLQILIESFGKPGDVVLDCNASIGMSHSLMSLILGFISILKFWQLIYLLLQTGASVYACHWISPLIENDVEVNLLQT